MKNALAIIAAFILIFAGFFGYVYSNTKEVRVLSNNFVHYISANQMAEAYAMLNKKLQAKVSLVVFTQQFTENKMNTLDHVDWTSFSVKNDIQSAEGALTLKSGFQGTIRIRVAKLDADPAYSIISYAFNGIINEDQL